VKRITQRSTANGDDVLMSATARYRVDVEKLQKAVAKELAARHSKGSNDLTPKRKPPFNS
jgi:hypothetical protein